MPRLSQRCQGLFQLRMLSPHVTQISLSLHLTLDVKIRLFGPTSNNNRVIARSFAALLLRSERRLLDARLPHFIYGPADHFLSVKNRARRRAGEERWASLSMMVAQQRLSTVDNMLAGLLFGRTCLPGYL